MRATYLALVKSLREELGPAGLEAVASEIKIERYRYRHDSAGTLASAIRDAMDPAFQVPEDRYSARRDRSAEAYWRSRLSAEVYDYANRVGGDGDNRALSNALASVIQSAGNLIGKMSPESESK